MGWFERQAAGRKVSEVQAEHARYVRAAGVDRALEALSGPFGLRRFMVGFRVDGGVLRLDEVVGVPLQWGGGPPPRDPTGQRMVRLERALQKLHRNMARGPAWTSGVVGYLRDPDGRVQLYTWFDDDAEGAHLDLLAVPGPPGHPLETPEYLRLRDQWESRTQAVHARTAATPSDWSGWTVERQGKLTLERGQPGQPGFDKRSHRAQVLARFEPRQQRFVWEVAEPLFEDDVFTWPDFICDHASAVELAMLTAARLDADWLFSGEFDEHGRTLLAAVYA